MVCLFKYLFASNYNWHLASFFLGGASGTLCNFDDFIGIDQGSIEGTGQGEDRFCGSKLLDHDFIICKLAPHVYYCD